MANTQQQSTGIRSDPGSEINPNRSIIPVDGKSFIVGKYDEYGHRKSAGKGADTQEISTITKLMTNSMRTRGGELMRGFIMTPDGPVRASQFTPAPKVAGPKSVKGKKVRQIKRAETKQSDQEYIQAVEESLQIDHEPAYETQLPEPVKETFPVVFNIESGTIKSSADAILEDELGLVLVYKDLDSISYVPKRGGRLTLALSGRTLTVMFLGITVQWYNTNQQLLLFVKTDQKE